jgi:hypothetical protein
MNHIGHAARERGVTSMANRLRGLTWLTVDHLSSLLAPHFSTVVTIYFRPVLVTKILFKAIFKGHPIKFISHLLGSDFHFRSVVQAAQPLHFRPSTRPAACAIFPLLFPRGFIYI